MSLRSSTLNSFLSEPSQDERELLELELQAPDIQPDVVSQSSFLNTLTGDLDARVIRINKNTDQSLIIVTQDKVLLCLKRNLAKIGKKEWIAPLSTVSTILISLITSDFRAALGLSPAEWKAMFIVSGFLATGWLAVAVRKALNSRNFHEVVRDVVYELGAQHKCS